MASGATPQRSRRCARHDSRYLRCGEKKPDSRLCLLREKCRAARVTRLGCTSPVLPTTTNRCSSLLGCFMTPGSTTRDALVGGEKTSWRPVERARVAGARRARLASSTCLEGLSFRFGGAWVRSVTKEPRGRGTSQLRSGPYWGTAWRRSSAPPRSHSSSIKGERRSEHARRGGCPPEHTCPRTTGVGSAFSLLRDRACALGRCLAGCVPDCLSRKV